MWKTLIAAALAVLALTACDQQEPAAVTQPGAPATEGAAQTPPGAASEEAGNKAPENVTDEVPTQKQLAPTGSPD